MDGGPGPPQCPRHLLLQVHQLVLADGHLALKENLVFVHQQVDEAARVQGEGDEGVAGNDEVEEGGVEVGEACGQVLLASKPVRALGREVN